MCDDCLSGGNALWEGFNVSWPALASLCVLTSTVLSCKLACQATLFIALKEVEGRWGGVLWFSHRNRRFCLTSCLLRGEWSSVSNVSLPTSTTCAIDVVSALFSCPAYLVVVGDFILLKILGGRSFVCCRYCDGFNKCGIGIGAGVLVLVSRWWGIWISCSREVNLFLDLELYDRGGERVFVWVAMGYSLYPLCLASSWCFVGPVARWYWNYELAS